jgi:hypothetical protein
MPWGLTRFQHGGQSHFATFCCYNPQRLLTTDNNRRIFMRWSRWRLRALGLRVRRWATDWLALAGGWPGLTLEGAPLKLCLGGGLCRRLHSQRERYSGTFSPACRPLRFDFQCADFPAGIVAEAAPRPILWAGD